MKTENQIPDMFSMLTGRKLQLFSYICETEQPTDSEKIAEVTGWQISTIRSAIRQMLLVGLLVRHDARSTPAKGRRSEQIVVPSRVREWWKLTVSTFGRVA